MTDNFTFGELLPTLAKFIQIATCGAENGHSLYALDESGRVWEWRGMDKTWTALSAQRGPL